MRTIIVDDHSLFRGGLVQLLNSQPDFEIVGEAGTILEAVLLVETKQPDLVIMDLGLPDGSGLDAIAKILSKKEDVKIVFLTIHDSHGSAFAAIRLGAKGFLLKSIEAPALLTSLRGLKRGELAVSRATLSHFVDAILPFLSLPSDNLSNPEVTLTSREIEILALLGHDISNREIASQLSISESTVKVHVHNILDKLRARNRQEAGEYARQLGLAETFT